MSTQYPPATQPGMPEPAPQGHPQAPAPAPRGTDPVSILGLVFAFLFWPLGLVLSLVGIGRTGKGKRPGRGLAIAGAVISAIAGVIAVVVIAAIAGTASQTSEELDAAAAEFEEEAAALEEQAEVEAEAADGEAVVEEEPADEEEPAEELAAEDVAAAVALGEPATVEDITFTVASEECGETTIGDEFLSIDAQGVFCLYDVSVVNRSNEPFLFDTSSITGFVGAAEYNASGEATFYIEDNNTFLENINPGNTVAGTIVFDVPDGVELDRLELSPGWLSSERAVVTLR